MGAPDQTKGSGGRKCYPYLTGGELRHRDQVLKLTREDVVELDLLSPRALSYPSPQCLLNLKLLYRGRSLGGAQSFVKD